MQQSTQQRQFSGVLQVDGYGGFKRLAGDWPDRSIRLVFRHGRMDRADFNQ